MSSKVITEGHPFVAANRARQHAAAAAQVEQLLRAVAVLEDPLPPHAARVAVLRFEHPQASLAELGRLAGLSKNAVRSRLRQIKSLSFAVGGWPHPQFVDWLMGIPARLVRSEP